MSNFNVILLVLQALLVLSPKVSTRRLYRNADCNNNNVQFTESQSRLLEEIQVVARKGGMADEDWQTITEYDEDVCYEIDCLESALEVISAVNFTVDPCKPRKWLDFACARRVNGPDNINQLERLIKLVEKQSLALLEDESGVHDGDVLFKEAQTHFYQCKHKAHADDADVRVILGQAEKYGNWPILTNKDPGEKFNWLHMLADLNRIERPGYSPYFFQVEVPEFFKKLGPVELNVGRAIFHVTNKDLINMLTLVQKKVGRKKPVRIEQIVPMLTLLTNVSSATVFQEEGQTVTIDDFQKLTDMYLAEHKIETIEIDWLDFFKRVFDGVDTIKVSPQLQVKICFKKAMSVIEAINTALNSKQKNERWAVSNLLQFQFVSTMLQEATVLLDDKNSFKCVELTGDRKEICLTTVEEVFGYALGATYIRTYYDDNITPIIENLVDSVKRGYVNIIGKTNWMEKTTQDFLIDKIKSIKTVIAYPRWIMNDDELLNFFDGLKLSTNKSSSYPVNYLNLNMWRLAKKRSWSYKYHNLTTWKGFPLFKGYMPTVPLGEHRFAWYDVEWNHYPATVQAQYHKAINEARIEAGVIQKPIFGTNRPGFMNYGGLAMIVGHEFAHMFDIIGRLFNKDGENEKEYWDEKSLNRYYTWVQQVAEQYGSEPYPLSETSAETVDPWKTINEDIADILAVYISHHSYQTYLKELRKKGEKEKVLPGLKKFSPQQLFYMKYANMWCDNKSIQDRYNDMLSDHSSGNTRASLPLKYSKQFAKAFNCKLPNDVLENNQ